MRAGNHRPLAAFRLQAGARQQKHAIRPGKRRVGPLLGQNHGGAGLTDDAHERVKKALGGNRVKAGGRLIKQQERGAHRHDGGKVQKLLLPAGERGDIAPEPVFNAEERRRLGDAGTNLGIRQPEVFRPERKLVPYLVGDDLCVRLLHDKADFSAVRTLPELPKRLPAIADLARCSPMRRKRRLDAAQECGLAAARAAAERDKLPCRNGERDIGKRRFISARISKGEIGKR